MSNRLINIAGWYGALAILAAYGLSSLNIVSTQNVWFQLLNLTGALCLLAVAWRHRAHQLTFINVVWAIIALFSLVAIWQ